MNLIYRPWTYQRAKVCMIANRLPIAVVRSGILDNPRFAAAEFIKFVPSDQFAGWQSQTLVENFQNSVIERQ